MRPGPNFSLKSLGVTQFLLAALLFAFIASGGVPARAFDEGIEAPSDDIEAPAQIAPDDAEAPSDDDVIESDEPDLGAPMRPDIKQGGEGLPPPHSAEENKQDKLDRSADDQPLPTPLERPKLLAELYAQLGKAKDAEAAAPIVEAIQDLWRLSGSATVDLLMSRGERFAKGDDLDLAL